MNKDNARKWILICELMMVLILIFYPVIKTQYYHEITGAQKAINGTMDLHNCDAYNKIILDGQWEFYWNQFIVSNQKQKFDADIMMKVPDNWSNYKLNGKPLPSGGYGSYRLTLKNFSYKNQIALYIPEFGGAYRVYIDGQLAAQSGIASENRNKIFTSPKATLYPLVLNTDSHEVVIEIATTRFSGLYIAPILCDYNQIVNEIDIHSSIQLILFGVAIFAFISLITMYIFSIRQKMYSFWMPVLLLCVLIRMMLTTQFYSLWQSILFFNLSFELTNELMYFVTFGMKFLIIFLVQEQCGILFSKKEKTGSFIYYALLYLIYLVVPQDIYNQYLSVLIPALTFALDIYLFVKIYIWRGRLNKYGMAVFLSELLIVVGLATNSYYINGKIYENMSLSLMIFFTLFLLIMVGVYMLRMGDLYDDFTVSSSRLELAGKQIAMQKEYYKALSGKMDEIREIKHDINHFTKVMLQLAEDGNFDRLKKFLNEYCEKTKMDQLPVFCEHTICNSIIGYYFLRAKEYGITFESHCIIDSQTIMSDSDLCIVLGNALQNAIYACRQMNPEQPRFVLIESKKMKEQRLIKVTNSYQGQLKIEDGRYLSLKDENSHGFGIRNMIKVIEAYEGFVKIEHNEGVFTFMAAIPE